MRSSSIWETGWSPAAVLGQARDLLADAETQAHPGDRFRIAHLAALRAAAAVLAAHDAVTAGAAPARRRPTSAWVLLAGLGDPYPRWAALFAGGTRKRAAADAGALDAVSEQDARHLLAAAAEFLAFVDAELSGPALWSLAS